MVTIRKNECYVVNDTRLKRSYNVINLRDEMKDHDSVIKKKNNILIFLGKKKIEKKC